jgi:hypothetical protein
MTFSILTLTVMNSIVMLSVTYAEFHKPLSRASSNSCDIAFLTYLGYLGQCDMNRKDPISQGKKGMRYLVVLSHTDFAKAHQPIFLSEIMMSVAALFISFVQNISGEGRKYKCY